jgi:hypothetical protein
MAWNVICEALGLNIGNGIADKTAVLAQLGMGHIWDTYGSTCSIYISAVKIYFQPFYYNYLSAFYLLRILYSHDPSTSLGYHSTLRHAYETLTPCYSHESP